MLRTTLALSTLALSISVAAQNFENKPDQTWISVSGTAIETNPSSFMLDYGDGQITVEMDDWEWFEEEGHGLIEGDNVTVYGEVDDDFAENAKIEASSVYLEDLGTYFYANSADEESGEPNKTLDVIAMDTTNIVDLNGTVSSVNNAEEEFTIDNGIQQWTIDVSGMDYNPLDKKGFQQIEKGDYVSVSGEFSNNLVESLEIEAERVTTAFIY
ncbi:DUF5666 domain-containing protein [Idiomarina sp. HP20-50]|uniref:DUF5666 domain-containing protein n=1 Tax=Idiomarina sp. HP20-50 TaxID=3070813 RepID=UPI00294B448A|nr:DUF5666 domain-containing protein [Idiomarina sp. HP20-50]MDV6316776.1 DUF5666 domain-containing protein [Idiomarina sp. HP20-50]